MDLNELTAISPIDGRYGAKTAALRPLFSEYGLIRHRVLVEVRWLQALAPIRDYGSAGLQREATAQLEAIVSNFSLDDAERVKEIERTTNHDVKAVEYFLKEKIAGNAELDAVTEFIHFACTSEDINNLSPCADAAKGRDDVLLPAMDAIMPHCANSRTTPPTLPMLSPHPRPDRPAPTTRGQGNGQRGASTAPSAGAAIGQVVNSRQDQRRGRQLQRPLSRLSRQSTGRPSPRTSSNRWA